MPKLPPLEMPVSFRFNMREDHGVELTALPLIVTHAQFETGSEELRVLEQKVYVASGRFVIEAGKPPVVE